VKRWTSIHGDRVQLVNLYGPTETTMTKFAYFVRPSDQERRFIPIGKPIQGARALVLDAKGRACAPGAVGEIYIRTPYRALGYYNQPELTAEVFIPNPFSDDPNDIVYKTGDLGRVLDDGNFEFLGRKDQQVKVRGVRIELREIEDLLRGHPKVSDVAVVDLDDVSGNKYLCAYVVLKEKAEAGALREFLAQSLPVYMVPSAIVPMAELPRTISGKLDRRALPTPAQAHAREQKDFVAPRTPVEETVAGMMCQVLGVDRISINDNFFELGGHSLLATQLLSRVRTVLDVEVPLRALFESPTVAGLALAITQLQVEQEDEDDMARMIDEIKRLTEDALESSLHEEMQATTPKEQ
jgi:acyl carrier protein